MNKLNGKILRIQQMDALEVASSYDFPGNCLVHIPLKFLYKFFSEEPKNRLGKKELCACSPFTQEAGELIKRFMPVANSPVKPGWQRSQWM